MNFNGKPLITVMVQADNPTRVKELMKASISEGAEAFGIQFEQMEEKFRKPEVYRDLFEHAGGRPVYVTNYRHTKNDGKTDDMLADELLELAGCGADICDVMGDCFDRQDGELTTDKYATEKQKELICSLHEKGAKALMSSHVLKYTEAERVLEIALEHQSRGADICKIVTGAETAAQQIENLKIINMLKENLKIPFLFLCGGECRILRRIGPSLGCCMYLCVHEYDELATPVQPLLKDIKLIRDVIEI